MPVYQVEYWYYLNLEKYLSTNNSPFVSSWQLVKVDELAPNYAEFNS